MGMSGKFKSPVSFKNPVRLTRDTSDKNAAAKETSESEEEDEEMEGLRKDIRDLRYIDAIKSSGKFGSLEHSGKLLKKGRSSLIYWSLHLPISGALSSTLSKSL